MMNDSHQKIWQKKKTVVIWLKKVNPKVVGLVVLLLGTLVAGSLAVQEGHGDPTVTPNPPKGDGG